VHRGIPAEGGMEPRVLETLEAVAVKFTQEKSRSWTEGQQGTHTGVHLDRCRGGLELRDKGQRSEA
jgi:hypothetical protein